MDVLCTLLHVSLATTPCLYHNILSYYHPYTSPITCFLCLLLSRYTVLLYDTYMLTNWPYLLSVLMKVSDQWEALQMECLKRAYTIIENSIL